MKDPKPLLREGASNFERQLLNAAMRERPSQQLQSRMRRTLGLAGPFAWASSVKAMLASLAGKGAFGVAVVGLVAAGAVGVGVSRDEGDAELAPSASTEAAGPALPAVSPPAVSTTAAKRTPAPAAAASNRELREEILLLDQARAALQRGSSATALQQLDRYRLRFPSGVLGREAAQLRQQASLAAKARGGAPSSH